MLVMIFLNSGLGKILPQQAASVVDSQLMTVASLIYLPSTFYYYYIVVGVMQCITWVPDGCRGLFFSSKIPSGRDIG